MANRINPEAAMDTGRIMGVQRAQGTQKTAARAAAIVGGPAARLDEYTASGETAAGLMIAVLERAAEQGVSDDAGEAMALLAAGQENAEDPGAVDDLAAAAPDTLEKTPEELAAEALEQAEEEEEGAAGAEEAKGKEGAGDAGGPGGSTMKTTTEDHCFCEGGKHDKTREGSEECYVVITAMTDAAGNRVDSPEVGQRKLMDELE